MTEVAEMYTNKLAQTFQSIPLESMQAKKRLLKDAGYFVTTVSALDSVVRLQVQLDVVVNNMNVVATVPEPTVSE
jgi:hypothetical protein